MSNNKTPQTPPTPQKTLPPPPPPPKNQEEEDVDWQVIRERALKRAFGGGITGSAAMVVQVCSLMWMRTTMNYQYRYGTTTGQALKHLYAEGGIRRFYRGIGPALFQGPLSRFGDTAANVGMLALLNSHPKTKNIPTPIKTLGASLAAASWRICLMPIDACKTTLQVEGKDGLKVLFNKFTTTKNPFIFWHGSLAAVSATFVGHYPWFAVFNQLDVTLPKPKETDDYYVLKKFGRRAVMGFSASVCSDTISNSIRVIKTTRQTFQTPVSYMGAISHVLKTDGYKGLFFRGLKTRILANGMQGLMFSVLWKSFQEMWFKEKN